MSEHISEHHCECGKLLCKGDFSGGIVEIKCRRCDRITRFGGKSATQHTIVLVTPEGLVKRFGPFGPDSEPISLTL